MRIWTRLSFPQLGFVPVFTLGSAALLLTLGAILTTSQETVYSVAQVQAQLAQNAPVWLGRTILVHGIVVGEPTAGASSRTDTWSPILVDAHRTVGVSPLPLAKGELDPLRALLRRLPWLGSRVAGEQVVHWGEIGDFRVQLRAQVPARCGHAVCYAAIVLDSDASS
jgi:hypothetical protein